MVEALLEEIGPWGAAMSLDYPLTRGTEITIDCTSCKLLGTIVACEKWPEGYFVQVEFPEEQEWAPEKFKPKRLFNPSSMVCKHRCCRTDCVKKECLSIGETGWRPTQTVDNSLSANPGLLQYE